ncbi:hypothetical protein P691DRAFT_798360 [Macrolepiota fuliginosa MF-IS2]|uniref:Uncharacterized protein n=1 Tax=Macrolepiota fuliginosa MF-IS2 TaxID=1400762 RepID=A0A9P5XNJ0_9AGAR|nr:hypothetical protein P691DRAFT_798360 [Macrolepiota fuliginosa MF-IS2]
MAKIDFPYGKKRNWELDTADADIGLKSITERERWLQHTFPKFTSKARGAKAPEPPPPHTIMSKGKCELIVGAHHFRDTIFYEVHYMQPASAVPALQAPSTSTPTTSYSSYFTITVPVTTPQVPGSSEDQDLSQLKLALGGGMEYTISADLVARIHHEASVNPIFATKFRLAVEPNATQEQIRNFAFALPHLPGVRVTGAPTSLTLSTEQQVRLPPVREWDLVIEFNEAPNERWLIPRGTLASCSRLVSKDGSDKSDVSFTLKLPLPETQPKPTNADEAGASEKASSDLVPPRPVKFELHQAPNTVYDLIINWIGGNDKNAENAAALAKIPKRQNVYVPHRLSQGQLLSQLQAAQTPNYTMKLLKQGPSNPPRPRRKPTQKQKPAPQGTIAAPVPTENASSTAPPPVEKPERMEKPAKEPKRRRYQATTKPAPVPIRCLVCFKTDVPLMMGGRYCRGCVDAGKANDAIPQLPPRGSQSSYSFTPYAPSPATAPPATASQSPVTQTPAAITSATASPVVPSTPQPQTTPQQTALKVTSPASEDTINAQSSSST